MPQASPSTLSISGTGAAAASSSSDRCRLTRGSTIRSTFHGGQLRDRGPPVYSAPPTSPTLSHHDTSPLPHARTRATSNLFSKLTSKLTRRYSKLIVALPSYLQCKHECYQATLLGGELCVIRLGLPPLHVAYYWLPNVDV